MVGQAGEIPSIWLTNEGAPVHASGALGGHRYRRSHGGVLLNVTATFMEGRWSGISSILVLDLTPLAGLYFGGMFYTTNVSADQYAVDRRICSAPASVGVLAGYTVLEVAVPARNMWK